MSDSRPASSIGAVTFVLRTTSTSAPRRADRVGQRRRPSGRARRRPRSRRLVRPSSPLCSNLSATSTFMVVVAMLRIRCDQQPVPQLRLEPRRLRRHDAAGVGDGHQVVDGDREHRERDRGACRSRRPARAPACRGRRRRSRCACRCGCRRCRAAARARDAAAARRRARWRASRPAARAATDRCAYHRPARYIATSPLRARRRRPVGDTANCSRSAARNSSGVRPARSFTMRLYGRICIWLSGNATAMKVFGVGRVAADLRQQRGARPRGARGAVVAVGDVERRNRRERARRARRVAAPDAPDRCAARRRRP